MSQTTYIARKGEDADFADLTCDTLAINGTPILATSILLGVGEVVDLNGEADSLILDADQNTTISAPTDNQIDIEINGADDFRFTANTFTALSGSTIATNTIAETTAASGVTVDGVLLKDGGAVFADAATIEVDTVNEATSAAGVTADGVLLKDGGIVCADAATLEVDTINEATSAAGVTVDGLLIKDGIVGAIQALTGDGAITIQNASVFLSKGSAAAITLAAPTNGTHDGRIIRVVAISAQAHVITGSVDGFNAKGSSGTATFGGAIGDSVTFVAYGGHWYTLSLVNVTIA